MNKFTSHEREYEIDKYGVINQTDYKPYKYDENYVSTYDTDDYRRKSDLLQALRLGFTLSAHGSRIETLLDYGYGNGAFMKFAKQIIPTIIGYDLTGVKVDDCHVLPHLVNVQVVTFWDALEHVPDISGLIQKLNCETIVISLPLCHFFTHGKDWFDNNYKHRKPDEHVHHFNEYSLRNFMSSVGWYDVAVSGHEDIVRTSAHGLQNILTMAFKKNK